MRTLESILSALAFLACIAVTIYLLTAPLYTHVETVHTESGEQTIQGIATLVEVNGILCFGESAKPNIQRILVPPRLLHLIRLPTKQMEPDQSGEASHTYS